MKVFGWTVYVDPGPAREAAMEKMLADACECLCLCSTAGCGCVTGSGEIVCSEQSIGNHFRTLQSEGPGWVIRVMEYSTVVRFELATEVSMGHEIEDLWQRVTATGLAASPSSGHIAG